MAKKRKQNIITPKDAALRTADINRMMFIFTAACFSAIVLLVMQQRDIIKYYSGRSAVFITAVILAVAAIFFFVKSKSSKKANRELYSYKFFNDGFIAVCLMFLAGAFLIFAAALEYIYYIAFNYLYIYLLIFLMLYFIYHIYRFDFFVLTCYNMIMFFHLLTFRYYYQNTSLFQIRNLFSVAAAFVISLLALIFVIIIKKKKGHLGKIRIFHRDFNIFLYITSCVACLAGLFLYWFIPGTYIYCLFLIAAQYLIAGIYTTATNK